eukprot:CAMPEP_0201940158 /NCGR_PEP_ID=MMETSP0903-20130614/44692_1 /ASSEMBLY_ACC=CAM_ASM_000552 /TAXON_ID=420261 /ORGANISM="Thalassiosira antarctica, Strain CCMP982" /LENGTH=168 /DNA_ID=CAMNT_0048481887 /DNA_START=39 /DNA_END=545 /DNA_ORIENTATION=-
MAFKQLNIFLFALVCMLSKATAAELTGGVYIEFPWSNSDENGSCNEEALLKIQLISEVANVMGGYGEVTYGSGWEGKFVERMNDHDDLLDLVGERDLGIGCNEGCRNLCWTTGIGHYCDCCGCCASQRNLRAEDHTPLTLGEMKGKADELCEAANIGCVKCDSTITEL